VIWKILRRSFDVIYSMDVIEHLPDPTELCERISELGNGQTVVIIGTPNYLGDDLVSRYHVREFSSDDLVALLSERLHVDEVRLLPMLRQDGIVHDDGFIACVGHLR
jgi:2-polyprenyl-3-methyl-5-hydroxy-6-metoxy-1,4-benzoquinol methylase